MIKQADNKFSDKIKKLYSELREKHGASDKQWRLWCKRPKTSAQKQEVIIGAILTQNTNWRNVAKAIDNLKEAGCCDLKQIYQLSKRKDKLERLIRPAGFFRQKTDYLLRLSEFILKKYKNAEKMAKAPLARLRQELLSLKGVGPETADSILLYALDKPIFVVDKYTQRLMEEKGITNDKKYTVLQELFHLSLKKDYRLYQDFHALIVINGKVKLK